MSYKLAIFCLLLACIGCVQTTETNSENVEQNIKNKDLQTMDSFENRSVMFYNVENLFDTENDPNNEGDDEFNPDSFKLWDSERYQEKLSQIEKALFLGNGNAPLMCGFAEVENHEVLEDLVKTNRLAKVNYKVILFDSEDRRGIDCGFIYDVDRFKPSLETTLKIRMEDDPDFRTRDILYIKGNLKGETELHIFVNHWSSKREGELETEPRRIAAAKTLRKKVDEILAYNEDANILIMGDFNDSPTNKSIRDVLRAKGEHELKNGDLVNLFLPEQKKGLGTAVHDRDWDVIDQLIVSSGIIQGKSGLAILKDSEHIVRHDDLLYHYPDGGSKPNATFGGNKYYGGFSDHLPICLTFVETKN